MNKNNITMTEQQEKHWFELGRKVERNNRTYFNSKEFWVGVLIGMIIMNLIKYIA